MNWTRTNRGFEWITHPTYGNLPSEGSDALVRESSLIGDYEDALDRPGSSFLWIGQHHHLDREEVAELIERLENWVDHGSLKTDREQDEMIEQRATT